MEYFSNPAYLQPRYAHLRNLSTQTKVSATFSMGTRKPSMDEVRDQLIGRLNVLMREKPPAAAMRARGFKTKWNGHLSTLQWLFFSITTCKADELFTYTRRIAKVVKRKPTSNDVHLVVTGARKRVAPDKFICKPGSK